MQHLTAAGVSVVFGEDDRRKPVLLHWGVALPDSAGPELAATAGTAARHSSVDTPASVSLAASGADGWSGVPAFAWHAKGVHPAALTPADVVVHDDAVEYVLVEARTHVTVRLRYRLHPSGVLEASAGLSNGGSDVVDVTAARVLLPVPDRAREILDFTGAWSGERRPQRRPVADGTWDRSGRRGRTGHDAPTLTSVGTPGFGYRSGEIWAAHVGWSGGSQVVVDRLPEGAGSFGAVIGGGELLLPGEIRLATGEEYWTPPVYFSWSGSGLDAAAGRLHALVRSFDAHPTSPRPLLLNSWEAVYFDHDMARLLPLVEAAAEVGVERFVLDDGWFLGRRDDTRGLGDWIVDPDVWPDGLRPLSDAVHDAGLEFGLWFEPEMVNPDSEMARNHPEWILADELGAQRLARTQQVLNLGDPACWDEVFLRISAIVREAGVDFIKWDHNRDLLEPVDRRSGRAGVHRQTAATYRMWDTLRAAHPGLEIESCASGGGRIDLGAAQHTQRVWASDTIDPLERQVIQRGTELLLPLEEIGTHVGDAPAHTTGRTTSLAFRMVTALFGHSGIEADLAKLGSEDRAVFVTWAALYKAQRGLLHSGDVVHADEVPDGASLLGVVSADRTHALFQWAQLEMGRSAADPRVRFPGIDPLRRYRVRFREEIGRAERHSRVDPAWCAGLGGEAAVELSGTLLAEVGVPLPLLQPLQALLIELSAVA